MVNLLNTRTSITQFFSLILILLLFAGCVSVSTSWAVPKGANSVLYVKRVDTIFSYGSKIYFYLDDRKIAEVEAEKYILLHVKPGTHKAEFKIFNSSGKETKSVQWSGELAPGTLSEAVINYFFGWQSTARFMEINTDIGILKGNFQEEIDLTGE